MQPAKKNSGRKRKTVMEFDKLKNRDQRAVGAGDGFTELGHGLPIAEVSPPKQHNGSSSCTGSRRTWRSTTRRRSNRVPQESKA